MAALTLNVSETLTIAEARSCAFDKRLSSSLFVKGDFIRKSNCVISDIAFKSAEVTLSEFSILFASGSALGYEPFRFAAVGEYDYQKALFKSVLTSSSGSSPRITKMQVEVDVPDVFDKGTATTSVNGPVTVFFNRSFYQVDEVICTLKGGTELGTPRVTPVNGFSFQLELYNSSNVRIAGTVSWSAKGY